MHHILEDKSFLSDFAPTAPVPIALSPPITLSREPATTKENVDSASELEFAREMRELRSGVVATVPAIQRRAEEDKEKLAKQREREEALQMGTTPSALAAAAAAAGGTGGAGGVGADGALGGVGAGGIGAKRRRVEKKKISYAKQTHQQQLLIHGANEGESFFGLHDVVSLPAPVADSLSIRLRRRDLAFWLGKGRLGRGGTTNFISTMYVFLLIAQREQPLISGSELFWASDSDLVPSEARHVPEP